MEKIVLICESLINFIKRDSEIIKKYKIYILENYDVDGKKRKRIEKDEKGPRKKKRKKEKEKETIIEGEPLNQKIITNKGFTIQEVNGVPNIIDGEIHMGTKGFKFKGNSVYLPNPNGKGGLANFTKRGYILDEVLSAIQKGIRLDKKKTVLGLMKEFINMPRPFWSRLKTRLSVICTEDIGPANFYIITRTYDVMKKLDTDLIYGDIQKDLIMNLAVEMCYSNKCRICDEITHALMNGSVDTYPILFDKLKYVFIFIFIYIFYELK